MPSKIKPKPPVKPAVTATRKALLAYHSELQKYHMKLEQWDALLTKRQEELVEARRDFERMMEDVDEFQEDFADEFEEDEECECGPQDALDGCECETCENWREYNPAAMRAAVDRERQYKNSRQYEVDQAEKVTGDEVQFLEQLFKLKDKRK